MLGRLLSTAASTLNPAAYSGRSNGTPLESVTEEDHSPTIIICTSGRGIGGIEGRLQRKGMGIGTSKDLSTAASTLNPAAYSGRSNGTPLESVTEEEHTSGAWVLERRRRLASGKRRPEVCSSSVTDSRGVPLLPPMRRPLVHMMIVGEWNWIQLKIFV
jgi:hypothetical protein